MGCSESDKQIAYSLGVKRPFVVRALRRSDIRRKIAKHLFDISPSGNYVSDIAYQVNTTPTNVIGALRGLNHRYKKDESLLDLDIVEEIESGKNIRLYRITEFGKEILGTFNERR